MKPPVPPGPPVARPVFAHLIHWDTHDKPRWSTAHCDKCDYARSVHDWDRYRMNWQPPKTCPISDIVHKSNMEAMAKS